MTPRDRKRAEREQAWRDRFNGVSHEARGSLAEQAADLLDALLDRAVPIVEEVFAPAKNLEEPMYIPAHWV